MDSMPSDSNMPSMPSVIAKLKEGPSEGQPRRSSFEEEDFGLPTGPDKKRISYGHHSSASPKSSATRHAAADYPPGKLGPRVSLSAKQKNDIAQAFESFDVKGTGYMSADDLRVALRGLGFDLKKPELLKLLEIFDRGKTGQLCYADFMTIIELKLGEPDTREDLIKAFNLFDKDKLGFIAFHNLRQVATELGEDVNDEEIAEMLAEADLDDNGTLDMEEFFKIMKKPE